MTRREFLGGMTGAAATTFSLKTLADAAAEAPAAARQPALFIGHGSPMNIVLDNAFTRSLRDTGERHGRPAALLVVSAHWLTDGHTSVSTNPRPQTIHDFGGFPAALYEVKYPAPGQPGLARAAAAAVTSLRVHEDHEMGLDHGAWSILKHLWPKADVPVFQLSIDYTRSPAFHYQLGRELRGLRDRGILLLGSGNIVHNLRLLGGDESLSRPFPWAQEFDAWAKERLEAGDHRALIDYEKKGSTARMAVPTSDHYLPMLYMLGALHPGERPRFTHESFQNGSISMRCFESTPG